MALGVGGGRVLIQRKESREHRERGFFYRSMTVYIPGMDEKALGGREGEAGLVIGREDLIPTFTAVGIHFHFPWKWPGDPRILWTNTSRRYTHMHTAPSLFDKKTPAFVSKCSTVVCTLFPSKGIMLPGHRLRGRHIKGLKVVKVSSWAPQFVYTLDKLERSYWESVCLVSRGPGWQTGMLVCCIGGGGEPSSSIRSETRGQHSLKEDQTCLTFS